VKTDDALLASIPRPELSGANLTGKQSLQRIWRAPKALDDPALIAPAICALVVPDPL